MVLPVGASLSLLTCGWLHSARIMRRVSDSLVLWRSRHGTLYRLFLSLCSLGVENRTMQYRIEKVMWPFSGWETLHGLGSRPKRSADCIHGLKDTRSILCSVSSKGYDSIAWLVILSGYSTLVQRPR